MSHLLLLYSLDGPTTKLKFYDIVPPMPNAKSAKNRNDAVKIEAKITWIAIENLILLAKWSTSATNDIMAKYNAGK